MESGNSKRESSTALTVVSLVVMLGGAAAVAKAGTEQALVSKHAWLVMIGLALFVAPISSVNIPGIKADVVLGDVVTFSCAVLFGPSAAVLAAVADGALTSLRITKKLQKILYNTATCAVSMALATRGTQAVFSDFGREGVRPPAGYVIGAIALFAASYFVIQTALIATYVASSTSQPLWKLWREKFLWTIISYAVSGVSAVAAFMLADRLGYLVFLGAAGVMVLTALFYKSFFNRAGLVRLASSVGPGANRERSGSGFGLQGSNE